MILIILVFFNLTILLSAMEGSGGASQGPEAVLVARSSHHRRSHSITSLDAESAGRLLRRTMDKRSWSNLPENYLLPHRRRHLQTSLWRDQQVIFPLLGSVSEEGPAQRVDEERVIDDLLARIERKLVELKRQGKISDEEFILRRLAAFRASLSKKRPLLEKMLTRCVIELEKERARGIDEHEQWLSSVLSPDLLPGAISSSGNLSQAGEPKPDEKEQLDMDVSQAAVDADHESTQKSSVQLPSGSSMISLCGSCIVC